MIDWIYENVPPWVYITVVVHLAILGTVAYLILLERKVASWVQDRIGPNRVGPKGLFQPLADGLKFILKEDYRPKHVDKVLFTVAPAIAIIVVIVTIAALPWGGTKQSRRTVTAAVPARASVEDLKAAAATKLPMGMHVVEAHEVGDVAQGTDEEGNPIPRMGKIDVTYWYKFQASDLNIGVLFILSILSLAVYGIVLGGWASNNKYAFLGALRATAQMICYEIPLGLAVLAVVVMYGTLDLNRIIESQAHYWGGFVPAWNVFTQPVAFLMFLICIHAEANRAPFDLAEAEQELVGGFHTEYSAMRFALFFLAEYASMITTSIICVALFFGGWHIPWLDIAFPKVFGNPAGSHPGLVESFWVCVLRAVVLFGKTIGIIFVFMWVRWSLPRFRFDQLMRLAWRGLIPIALAVLVVTALVIYVAGPHSKTFRSGDRRLDGTVALALLIANVILMAVVMIVSLWLPAPSDTNKRVRVINSRFGNDVAAAAGNN